MEEEGEYPVVRAVERISSQKLYNKKFGCVFLENFWKWIGMGNF